MKKLRLKLLHTLSTSLFMFHLISFGPCFIVSFSYYFLQSTLHWSCFIFISFSPQSISFYLPQSISFIFTLFGCIHITWSFNLIVSFTFQPIPSLEINNLQVYLDIFLVLNIHYLKLSSGGFTTLVLIISRIGSHELTAYLTVFNLYKLSELWPYYQKHVNQITLNHTTL